MVVNSTVHAEVNMKTIPPKFVLHYTHREYDNDEYFGVDELGVVWCTQGHYYDWYKTHYHYKEWVTCMSSRCPQFCLEIRKHFNLKPELPDWMRIALKSGWTPPSDFDRSIYE